MEKNKDLAYLETQYYTTRAYDWDVVDDTVLETRGILKVIHLGNANPDIEKTTSEFITAKMKKTTFSFLPSAIKKQLKESDETLLYFEYPLSKDVIPFIDEEFDLFDQKNIELLEWYITPDFQAKKSQSC